MPKERLETTFHETFALNLPAIADVLRVCKLFDGKVDPHILRAETSLGPNYIKSMPRYARGCGLLKMGTLEVTPFGSAVLKNDPNLMRSETHWLMHYHMSSPQGPGPSFWSKVITGPFRIGRSIRRLEVSEAIRAHVNEATNKVLSERTLDSTATAFLGTYAKSDGLGALGLLDQTEENQGTYTINQPEPPTPETLAYALSDYWASCHPDSTEVLLRDLGHAQGFAGIFLMGTGMLGSSLTELQSAGVLGIKRDAPPFVVTKLWRDTQQLLDRVYG